LGGREGCAFSRTEGGVTESCRVGGGEPGSYKGVRECVKLAAIKPPGGRSMGVPWGEGELHRRGSKTDKDLRKGPYLLPLVEKKSVKQKWGCRGGVRRGGVYSKTKPRRPSGTSHRKRKRRKTGDTSYGTLKRGKGQKCKMKRRRGKIRENKGGGKKDISERERR